MANHKSSKKMIRKITRRTSINTMRKSRIKTFTKNVESAIASGDKKKAQEALKAAQPEMAKGISKGVYKKNTIARKISRLSAKIKTMAA